MKTLASSIFLIILIILIILPLYAAEEAENPLRAHILISDKPDEKNPNRITVQEFAIGDTAYCAFAASGAARNGKNEVDLYASVDLITPENKTLFSEDRYAHTNIALRPDQKAVVLNESFDMVFDASDKPGMYTLKVSITDTVADKTASTETTLLLFSSAQAKELVMSPVKSAKHLDDLWALYFKTGNPWAVKRIISAIKLKHARDLEKAIIGEAAIWSLQSNAYQHPEVYAICQGALKSTKGAALELLNGIIAKVDARKKE